MHSNYKNIAGGIARGSVLGTLAIAAAWGCGKKDSEQAAAPAMPPPAVMVASATSADVPIFIDEIGRINGSQSVTITPRIAGAIVGRFFEDGADVKKDQMLFAIDPAPAQAALASAKAQQAQAAAALAFAKIELDRYTAVAGTKAISKSDLDTKKNAVDVADAQVASADAAVTTAELNLSFCSVKSPIDGRAGARMVDVGNVVKENEASLLSVQTIDPIYADFTVNEQQLATVQENMATGTLKVFVKIPSDTGDGTEGSLTFLDNAVQDATGTVKLRATLKNADHHFWPGQFCTSRLILKTLKDAVMIPRTATQVSQQGLFVFRVDSDDKSPTKMAAAMQTITLGQVHGDMVVVTKGLHAGDKVITSGQMTVQPGSAVMVVVPGAPDADMGKPAADPSKQSPAKAGGGAPAAKMNDGSKS